MSLTLEQLIEIAKAGYPERAKNFIDFDNLDIYKRGDIYRLYDPTKGFRLFLPEKTILSIEYREGWTSFNQIKNFAFNHFAAIKKMIELNLIDLTTIPETDY